LPVRGNRWAPRAAIYPCAVYEKRFPVPQDNFVPVAVSSYSLVGGLDMNRAK